MKRRSITLYPLMESVVREFQADLLKLLDRDITFTEALNLLLLGGLLANSAEEVKKTLGKEGLCNFLDNTEMRLQAILDAVQDAAQKPALPAGKSSG